MDNNTERTKRWALLGLIIKKLGARRAQCGNTRIQKAAYFAKEMCEIDLPAYDFTLYRYGPYSDEVTGDLNIMQIWDLLTREKTNTGLSYKFHFNDKSVTKEIFEECKREHGEKIKYIVKRFANNNVGHLERLSTAHWVIKNMVPPSANLDEKVKYLRELKSYLSEIEAKKALKIAERMIEGAGTLICHYGGARAPVSMRFITKKPYSVADSCA